MKDPNRIQRSWEELTNRRLKERLKVDLKNTAIFKKSHQRYKEILQWNDEKVNVKINDYVNQNFNQPNHNLEYWYRFLMDLQPTNPPTENQPSDTNNTDPNPNPTPPNSNDTSTNQPENSQDQPTPIENDPPQPPISNEIVLERNEINTSLDTEINKTIINTPNTNLKEKFIEFKNQLQNEPNNDKHKKLLQDIKTFNDTLNEVYTKLNQLKENAQIKKVLDRFNENNNIITLIDGINDNNNIINEINTLKTDYDTLINVGVEIKERILNDTTLSSYISNNESINNINTFNNDDYINNYLQEQTFKNWLSLIKYYVRKLKFHNYNLDDLDTNLINYKRVLDTNFKDEFYQQYPTFNLRKPIFNQTLKYINNILKEHIKILGVDLFNIFSLKIFNDEIFEFKDELKFIDRLDNNLNLILRKTAEEIGIGGVRDIFEYGKEKLVENNSEFNVLEYENEDNSKFNTYINFFDLNNGGIVKFSNNSYDLKNYLSYFKDRNWFNNWVTNHNSNVLYNDIILYGTFLNGFSFKYLYMNDDHNLFEVLNFKVFNMINDLDNGNNNNLQHNTDSSYKNSLKNINLEFYNSDDVDSIDEIEKVVIPISINDLNNKTIIKEFNFKREFFRVKNRKFPYEVGKNNLFNITYDWKDNVSKTIPSIQITTKSVYNNSLRHYFNNYFQSHNIDNKYMFPLNDENNFKNYILELEVKINNETYTLKLVEPQTNVKEISENQEIINKVLDEDYSFDRLIKKMIYKENEINKNFKKLWYIATKKYIKGDKRLSVNISMLNSNGIDVFNKKFESFNETLNNFITNIYDTKQNIDTQLLSILEDAIDLFYNTIIDDIEEYKNQIQSLIDRINQL